MSANILEGPKDDMGLPSQSLGILIFEALKRRQPNMTIMVDFANKERITCDQFLKTSVKLVAALKKLGIKKGDIVTIISENNWKYLATILAVFFVGATVNLLNHDYISGELKYFLKICQPVLIFCTEKSLENLLTFRNESFLIETAFVIYDSPTSSHAKNFDDLLQENDFDENCKPVDLDPKQEVAFIVISSGTTGPPKCVKLTHSNFRITMVNAGNPNGLDINRNDSIIGYLPFFHVYGSLLSFACICYDVEYIIIKKFNPDTVLKIIEDYKITKLFVVPPLLHFLATSPLVAKYDISSLQDIICGGAPAAIELLQAVQNRLNIKSLRLIYGMTETSGAAIITHKDVIKFDTVGKTAIGYQIKVCDIETGTPLGPCQTGELHISGPGIMKGYLEDNVDYNNIFDQEGFLKTGDLGYYDADGFFYIVDRLKDIIKYKGFQVSPVELESLLLQHPSIKDAGVIGLPDEKAGELPLAFVVKYSNATITETDIVRFVEENISVQKRLYGGVRFIEEIPRNATGKILRRKLRHLL